MQQMAARSGGILTFGLRTTSANLYCSSSSGPRRFLSLRADGRLRLVLAYLRSAGLDTIIDGLVDAAAPAFTIGRGDRAGGIRYAAASEEKIIGFLARVESALAAAAKYPS
jgi:hypothetical protein